jgi:hypothetical protein
MKRNLNTPKKELSDEEYWKQYALQKDEEDFESMQNHDINMEIICKFSGLNGGVIYETKEKAINCNLDDLETWFGKLKKTIRMLDESISDKEVGEFD